MVKLLCLRGADPHATDKEGYTPLDDARYRGSDRCCAVESPERQWARVAAFLDKVAPMAAEERRAFAQRSWDLALCARLQEANPNPNPNPNP